MRVRLVAIAHGGGWTELRHLYYKRIADIQDTQRCDKQRCLATNFDTYSTAKGGVPHEKMSEKLQQLL